MNKKRFLTTGEIASILHVTRVTVYRWAKSGKLKAYQTPGGTYHVLRKDFAEFLRKSGMDDLAANHNFKTPVKILVVDDEPEIVEIIKAFLEKSNPHYHVVGATSGFEAGHLISSFRPDVVILDLVMPGVDGFSVCRKIKSDPHTKGTRIIAITTHSSDENLEKIRKEGANIILTKPFDYHKLLSIVKKLTKSSFYK